MNYYIKQSPITGLAGFGGGASGLNVAGSAIPVWYGDRALKWGGANMSGGYYDMIEYKNITNTADAEDFGDLDQGRSLMPGCSDAKTAVLFNGYIKSAANYSSDIHKLTISTLGDAVDFGNLTQGIHGNSACSNGTLGFSVGGYGPKSSPVNITQIEVVTIATDGNATDAGDITSGGSATNTSVNDDTRAVRCGGFSTGSGDPKQDTMDYFTMANSGITSTDFGDLSYPCNSNAGCSNDTRGVIALGLITDSGSGVYTNIIDYITIQTTSDATDFGDLTQARNDLASCSNNVRGIFMAGYFWPGNYTYDIIDKVEIDTTANATDIGELTLDVWASKSTSGDA